MAARSFDRPRGTRDLYPEDYLQRRYITETWRRVALRHGFDEIDGPTFEHLDLYTVKSGEGIVSELFSFSRAGGDETYALRPEYTPTLARQYAARAGQLPKPTRWFSIGPYFRAERPQRGRLREFLQWNVDVLHPFDNNPETFAEQHVQIDSEHIALLALSMADFGFSSSDVSIRIGSRSGLESSLRRMLNFSGENIDPVFSLVDAAHKLAESDWVAKAVSLGIDPLAAENLIRNIKQGLSLAGSAVTTAKKDQRVEFWSTLFAHIELQGVTEWTTLDFYLARGLAYYTDTVFELVAEGERAVAGGGRYDKLIELLGGPPTPAVGFAMGDVVLANLLEDKGLMPKGKDLLTALSQPIPTRPDVFVIAGPEAQEDAILRTCATLRRGVEHDGEREPWRPDRYEVPPLHTRRSYKATRNVGKLLKDAASANARFAVIVESDAQATVKDLDSGEQWSDKVALDDLAARLSAAL